MILVRELNRVQRKSNPNLYIGVCIYMYGVADFREREVEKKNRVILQISRALIFIFCLIYFVWVKVHLDGRKLEFFCVWSMAQG